MEAIETGRPIHLLWDQKNIARIQPCVQIPPGKNRHSEYTGNFPELFLEGLKEVEEGFNCARATFLFLPALLDETVKSCL